MCQRRSHQVLGIRSLQEFTDQLGITYIQMSKWFIDEAEAAGTVVRLQQADQQYQLFHDLLAT